MIEKTFLIRKARGHQDHHETGELLLVFPNQSRCMKDSHLGNIKDEGKEFSLPSQRIRNLVSIEIKFLAVMS